MTAMTGRILELKTRIYWHVSRVWNGQSTDSMNTGYALRELGELRQASKVNPNLHKHVSALLQEIIVGVESAPKRARK